MNRYSVDDRGPSLDKDGYWCLFEDAQREMDRLARRVIELQELVDDAAFLLERPGDSWDPGWQSLAYNWQLSRQED